jgi:membrane protease YdiL (CAAX protease family)
MLKLLTETGGVQQVALLDALAPLAATTVLPLLAMLVVMTAFFEEAAFRGYMQVQLEDRYGPAVAVFFTALLFAAVHFPAPGQLPLFVFGSLGWGVLTFLSRTILPAIVMHGVVDGVMFLWVWMNPDAFRALLEHNVLLNGISDLFVIWMAIAVIGTVATILGLFMLAKAPGRELPGGLVGGEDL